MRDGHKSRGIREKGRIGAAASGRVFVRRSLLFARLIVGLGRRASWWTASRVSIEYSTFRGPASPVLQQRTVCGTIVPPLPRILSSNSPVR